MKLKVLAQSEWTVCAVASYAQGQDTCQIEDFFIGLETKDGGSGDGMLQLIAYVAENGPRQLPDSLSHYIDQNEKIWEFIKGRLRVAWFYDEGQCVICTHGFIKDSQKVKKADKNYAIRMKEEYFAAKSAGTLKIIT